MTTIKSIRAREVLDSRGNPTVEVDLRTDDGLFRAIVPSGASAGVHEALELRDGEKRYGGLGTKKAVDNVNRIIAPKLIGYEVSDQREIDSAMGEMDGSKKKDSLGANAILPISIAACKAASAAEGLWTYEYIGKLFGQTPDMLPVPQLNVINGGKHAGQEKDIQEHMIMPVFADSFAEALQAAAEVYHNLKKIFKKKYGAQGTLIGDEGGYAPPIHSVSERLDIISSAIAEAGYGESEIKFALDSASSEFFEDGTYRVGDKKMDSAEMVEYYLELVDSYPIVSIEDGMAEDDWDGWVALTDALGSRIQIVGDDLLVTNTERIKRAIDLSAANSALIKLNQIGTVSETLDAIRTACDAKWTAVVSHRSGETEDDFIADLAVGVNAGQSKFGAPARSDRTAKYNQLLRIEENLGARAKYGGRMWSAD